MTAPLLEVRGLGVTFATPAGPVAAVRDLDLTVAPGEMLAVVGESGSGKTQAALAMLGLLAANGRAQGQVLFAGEDLLAASPGRLNELRGSRIAMVFQDPMTALNPYLTIGEQMGLVLRAHRKIGRRAARAECLAMLAAVRVTDPARRLEMHPHELSGGMRQRVMIATAFLGGPALLIADEPTTALDVTVQAEVLRLIADYRVRHRLAVLLITHDLGIVAGTCDRMLVMRGGRQQEEGTVEDVFRSPRTAYTRSLLAAVPRIDGPGGAPALPADAASVLTVEGLAVNYRVPGPAFAPDRTLQALADIRLELRAGETLGVVGESGCGKSTLARAILGLVPAGQGRIVLLGRDLAGLAEAEFRPARRDLQLVFQDPFAALDPRMTIREIVTEPLEAFEPGLGADELRRRAGEALERVGLAVGHLDRYPHQFSGGQCQRISIARALILKPQLLVCDEAVSALDVTIQAQVIALLRDLQAELGIAMLFIAHDLAVVRELCHRVLVLYLGRAMELAPAAELYRSPRHPYTRALLRAVPVPDPVRARSAPPALLEGEVPSPLAPPSGCPFRTRCPEVIPRCAAEVPALRVVGSGQVACHRVGEPAPVA